MIACRDSLALWMAWLAMKHELLNPIKLTLHTALAASNPSMPTSSHATPAATPRTGTPTHADAGDDSPAPGRLDSV